MKNKREAVFVTALLTVAIVFVIEQLAISIHSNCIGVSHEVVDVKPGFCIKVKGKGMCRDNGYVDYLNRTIKWRMEH